MAGTTNRCFRLLCRRGGAGLVYSEMVSANALHHGSRRTEQVHLRSFPAERPLAVQIFGAHPQVMAHAVAWVERSGADIVDINMGCTVPKVRRCGAGVELMADPERAVAVVRAVVARSSLPVTVKLRAGLHAGDRGYLELARRLQDLGVAAFALHARTAAQGFAGAADWSAISELVERVAVPVIGNGDVTTAADAARMVAQTGCAAVMIARAAWGRPWFFAQAAAAMAGRPVPPDPPPAARLGVALCHAQMLALDLGERIALHQLRGQLRWYAHGLPHARQFRAATAAATSLAQLCDLIEGYVRSLSDHDRPQQQLADVQFDGAELAGSARRLASGQGPPWTGASENEARAEH